ncbi:MAG: cellulase family glycosylhydrolase [Acidobacteria bacterium]|nr:cellulase family glycosylhydrolase [Acidobacteriota bacterium]
MRKIALIFLGFLHAMLGARSAAAQNPHYGMNTNILTAQMADKMVELGAGVVRVDFGWDVIEANCKGCLDWQGTDAIRDQARRTNRQVFATLAYVPKWANGGQSNRTPPLNYQDWYDFVFAAASRYKNDIFLWGIWNEPNLDVFLVNGDLKSYRSLVIAAHAAIRAANPQAFILGPEASWHATTDGWYAAAMNDFGDLFDIVTVHWYLDGPSLDFFMDGLVRPGALNRPVWLTEIGMKPCFSIFGEIGQAMLYQKVLSLYEARRSWWTGLVFYNLYDTPTSRDCGAAIVRPDWTNRPAFLVLQNFIRAFP